MKNYIYEVTHMEEDGFAYLRQLTPCGPCSSGFKTFSNMSKVIDKGDSTTDDEDLLTAYSIAAYRLGQSGVLKDSDLSSFEDVYTASIKVNISNCNRSCGIGDELMGFIFKNNDKGSSYFIAL